MSIQNGDEIAESRKAKSILAIASSANLNFIPVLLLSQILY